MPAEKLKAIVDAAKAVMKGKDWESKR